MKNYSTDGSLYMLSPLCRAEPISVLQAIAEDEGRVSVPVLDRQTLATIARLITKHRWLVETTHALPEGWIKYRVTNAGRDAMECHMTKTVTHTH